MTETPLRLSGDSPPVYTPRGTHGELDRDSVARLVTFLVKAGVSGLFIAGSTSEATVLDNETRLASLRVAVEAAGRVPVLFGVGDTGPRRVVDWAALAAETGRSRRRCRIDGGRPRGLQGSTAVTRDR